jgi:hypothetical protein
MSMTKAEFAARWDKDDTGDGITYNEIADCAKAWGLYQFPRTCPITEVRDRVVKASGALT